MRLVIAAVFDSKVGAYAQPMFFRSKGEAVRSFENAVQDEKGPFVKNRGDYSLFYLGEFDDGDGSIYSNVERALGADEVGV